MRSWVTGGVYGLASSVIVLTIVSLVSPRQVALSDAPPLAGAEDIALANTKDGEDGSVLLSGVQDGPNRGAVPAELVVEATADAQPVARPEAPKGHVDVATVEVTLAAAPVVDAVSDLPGEFSDDYLLWRPALPRAPGVDFDVLPTLDRRPPEKLVEEVKVTPPPAEPKVEPAPVAPAATPETPAVPVVENEKVQPPPPLPEKIVTDAAPTPAENGSTLAPNKPVFVQVGTAPAPEAADPNANKDAMAENAAEPTVEPTGKALVDNAAPFTPTDLPLIAIVLLPGGGDIATTGLPLTRAVDAAAGDAQDQILSLREAGQEAVLITPLPDGARAADVEVAFETYLDHAPGAVGFIEAAPGAYRNRDAAAAIIAIAAAGGYGVVSTAVGLNPIKQLSTPAGVAAGLVQADLTPVAQDDAALMRALDQAAFKAGQEGSVILTLVPSEKALGTIEDWLATPRGKTVSLAPVSAALAAR